MFVKLLLSVEKLCLCQSRDLDRKHRTKIHLMFSICIIIRKPRRPFLEYDVTFCSKCMSSCKLCTRPSCLLVFMSQTVFHTTITRITPISVTLYVITHEFYVFVWPLFHPHTHTLSINHTSYVNKKRKTKT